MLARRNVQYLGLSRDTCHWKIVLGKPYRVIYCIMNFLHCFSLSHNAETGQFHVCYLSWHVNEHGNVHSLLSLSLVHQYAASSLLEIHVVRHWLVLKRTNATAAVRLMRNKSGVLARLPQVKSVSHHCSEPTKSSHSFIIWDIAIKLVPLCSVHPMPSQESCFILPAPVLTNLAHFRMLFIP